MSAESILLQHPSFLAHCYTVPESSTVAISIHVSLKKQCKAFKKRGLFIVCIFYGSIPQFLPI
jgi:hypothetical protein